MGVDFNRAVGWAKGINTRGEAGRRSVEVPVDLGWDQATFPIAPSIIYGSTGIRKGAPGYNPFASADYLAARAGVNYYVATGGSDAANGLTTGTAFATMQKALAVVKTGAVAATINVAAGTYSRTAGTFSAVDTATAPLALVAYNGRVKTGSYDTLTWSANGTYSWVSQATRSNVLRVVDLKNLDRNGLYREYTPVASLVLCSQTAGTFFTDATTVYVNPSPGVTVGNTTVRAYLIANGWRFTYAVAPPSIFILGETASDGFDIEGGQGGALRASGPGISAASKVFAVRNCTWRYGGGDVALSGGVYIEGWPGLVYAENCDASAGYSDNWNTHNVTAVNPMSFLNVNCTGRDAGRSLTTAAISAATSANGLTTHDNCVGIDLCGDYRDARGKTVHNINASKLLCAGTIAGGSVGDKMNGGSFDPAEFAADNTAQLWLDDVVSRPLNASQIAILAGDTAAIRYRNLGPEGGAMVAASGATIAEY